VGVDHVRILTGKFCAKYENVIMLKKDRDNYVFTSTMIDFAHYNSLTQVYSN
jgi:hypothetical protein